MGFALKRTVQCAKCPWKTSTNPLDISDLPKVKPKKWVVKSGGLYMHEAPTANLCWYFIKMHGLNHLKPIAIY